MQRIDPVGASGRRANQHGREALEEIERILQTHGYRTQRRVLIGESIFGKRQHADLVVEDSLRWPDGLIVEVMSQKGAGTTEQKLVYVVENIRSQYPRPTVIVLVGGGFSEGAVAWLESQVDGKNLVGTSSMREFENWVSRAIAS
jgi:hypothetical protein